MREQRRHFLWEPMLFQYYYIFLFGQELQGELEWGRLQNRLRAAAGIGADSSRLTRSTNNRQWGGCWSGAGYKIDYGLQLVLEQTVRG